MLVETTLPMLDVSLVVLNPHLWRERHARNSVLRLELFDQPISNRACHLVALVRGLRLGTVGPGERHVGKLQVFLIDQVLDALALVFADLLGGRVIKLLNRLYGEVLLIIICFIRLTLKLLLLCAPENLLNFIFLEAALLLRADAREFAAANRVVPVFEFVGQNPVVLRLVQII